MLLFLHTRDKREQQAARKCQIYNCRYHIQDIKNVQHKDININWDYWKFPWHPVAAEKFETRGRNTIIFNYHYRVYPKLGEGVCAIFRIPCACPACVA